MKPIIKIMAGKIMAGVAAMALSGVAGAQPVSVSPAPPPLPTQVVGPEHAPQGAVAIAVYGQANPGKISDEIETRFMGRETVVRNVTYPTLTPVLPKPGTANGTAVIVAPGGGFMMLSMQNEGWRVAQALADKGVTAFVLKYRLNPTPASDAEWLQDMARLFRPPADGAQAARPQIKDPGAGVDALAALKLVRGRAGEWGVDPRRVGMIGFSAGAMATLTAVLQADLDGDPQTRAPDFIGYVYGPMARVEVPAGAPPMFAALAIDDPLFGNGDFSIVSGWHAAKRPAELHVYQAGGHGFGMGQPGTTSTLLMDQFLAWMGMQGLLAKR